MDTVVLAPAGYLLDPDIGSDYERPWRLVEGLALRGFRVVTVARHVRHRERLGASVLVEVPPGRYPNSPTARIFDRFNLYLHARRVAQREVRQGHATIVHHLGPCGPQSPSLIPRLSVPFVYGPLPGTSQMDLDDDDEWLSWLLTPSASHRQETMSKRFARFAGLGAKILWRRTMRRADAITVEAKANAPSFVTRPVVIPPGIDSAQFSPGGSDVSVAGRVIAVGRLLYRKGYDLLIEAMARVIRQQPNAHLILVGSGPQESALRQLAATLGIASSVTFAGTVERVRLPDLLNSAKIFCHPARWDNVPFALLEAMACGLTPIVASTGGLPEIVGDNGIVYSPGDIDELARAITTLLTNPQLNRSLAASARGRVVERFTWDAMCNSYVQLYQDLIRSRGAMSHADNPGL